MSRCTVLAALAVFAFSSHQSAAHPGHGAHDDGSVAVAAAPAEATDAVTGQGPYRFRHNAELSSLPPEIAKGITRAHGGFAINPAGEIFFGLEGTGLVRISADLREKTLVKAEGPLLQGGLHNTTYVPEDGSLVLPDNNGGRLLQVDQSGELVASLGRPDGAIDAYYEDEANTYNPTDTVVAPDGTLYVVDGYSKSKQVLAADLESKAYTRRVGGGPAEKGKPEPGLFSTCHGLTWDPTDETLTIADRELHRVQKIKPTGEFVAEYPVDGANPCDVEFVSWGDEPLGVVGCLRGKGYSFGVVQLMRGDEIVATLKPKDDLGLEAFDHIHNAIGVVVSEKLYVLCYGWNPGCFAVLEHISE